MEGTGGLNVQVGIDIKKIRSEFPILHQEVNGKPLVYFDNAASSQKPQQVIDAIDDYYGRYNANIHRGVHHLSQVATDAYEKARRTTQAFINAEQEHEVLFTAGTTDAINLVAQTWGRQNIQKGDEIILTQLEHHSNIVPWQMLAEEKGAVIKVIDINEAGELDVEGYKGLLCNATKLVAFNHISNALGTLNPAKEMISLAHDAGAIVLIDGAQSVPHMEVDVQELDADFYTFSAHKICGPTGVGVLYGKEVLLEKMPPWRGGGEMIKTVSFSGTTYNELPFKFEAGTPHIEGGIVMGAAMDYLNNIGLENIAAYEAELLDYGMQKMEALGFIDFVGTAKEKASVISFNMKDAHPYDVGTILDKLGIAVRTGHHCCQPLMERLGVPGTVRASFAFYNTKEEIDAMVSGLERAHRMFS
ncbi:MAG: cysteine desulfurase [Flavobacteriales bacterium]